MTASCLKKKREYFLFSQGGKAAKGPQSEARFYRSIPAYFDSNIDSCIDPDSNSYSYING